MNTKQQKKKGKGTEADIVLGENLRRLRMIRGLSQKKLGDEVGITFQQIQKYEKGTNRISASRLLEFSQVLKFDFNMFYNSLIEEQDRVEFETLNPKLYRIIALLLDLDDETLIKDLENIVKTILELDSKREEKK